MRIPSKRMPRLPEQAMFPTWGAIVLFLLIPSWLLSFTFAFPAITAYVCFIAALAHQGHIISERDKSSFAALARQREGESICTFTRSLDYRRIDTWVIRAVYEWLQQDLNYLFPRFPLRPTDHMTDDLLIDEEDLGFGVLDIAKRAGRSLKNCEANPFYAKVHTVGDLIAFLNAQPRKPAMA